MFLKLPSSPCIIKNKNICGRIDFLVPVFPRGQLCPPHLPKAQSPAPGDLYVRLLRATKRELSLWGVGEFFLERKAHLIRLLACCCCY